ncbi:hypothetical protein J2S17_002206 [Cytobacillus purgationiresistens]|uniref:Uncharacterized protein n=1 Tax=Cytobacillus purgationiresistens TaxID=863449 RepID=A0ABU0AGF0_9BACI|nr:hypothetical protein [Cytobacillus purgationiresistens]
MFGASMSIILFYEFQLVYLMNDYITITGMTDAF